MPHPDALPDAAADTAPRRGAAVVEALAAMALGVLLAVVVRRPQDLATTVPGDPRDPVLLSWVLAWPAHALTSADRLWDGNILAPLDNTFAFTDALLGYLPFGLVGEGPAAALVRYNAVLLFTSALAFAGTWVLVRQLGLGRAAALVAATAFAFNPWRISQLNHLQILSSGGIPLALAMLARGHGLHLRPGRGPFRPGWVLAGWLTAAWQVSLGFGLGLQTAYLLAGCAAVGGLRLALAARRSRTLPPRRLLVANAVGMVLFLVVGLALAQPYLRAVEEHPEARRSVDEVALFSPTAGSLLTAPPESFAWGRYTEDRRADVAFLNEKALFPGLLVTALAVTGLLLPGPWSGRRRIGLAVGVAVLVVLALGTNGPAGGRAGFLVLYEHLPGWQGIRTPGRLVTTAWLGLALLAAHGVAAGLAALRRSRTAGAGPALAVALAALVLVEGLDTAGQTAVRPPPTGFALRDLPEPVFVLNSEDYSDQDVMRWSTDGFPRIVNGISGFTPDEQNELRDAASRLPDPLALARLRESGIRTLVLLPGTLPGTRYERVEPGALAQLPGVVVEPRGEAFVVSIGGTP